MWRDLIGIAVLLGASIALALTVEGYTLHRFTLAGVFAIALCGLNLLTGLSGQLSIGHGALYAVGAYTVAIGMRHLGIDPFLCVPLGGALAFAAGYLVGLPTARFGLVELALTTWALAVALPQILKSSLLAPWTGGVQGMYLDRPGAPAGLPLSDDQWWFAVVLGTLCVALLVLRNLRESRSGRALRALADQPIAARTMGIDVARARALAFAASGAFAGVAGALGALLVDFVGPDSFTVWFSIELLIGAVVGGVYSVWGAVLGGLLMKFLPDLARSATGTLALAVWGAMLIAIVSLLPRGLASLRLPAVRRARPR